MRTKILVIGLPIIFITLAGAYFYAHQLTPVQFTQGPCLGADEVGSRDTSAGRNDIVVKNKGTNAEVYRFSLPTSTWLFNGMDECNIFVTVGNKVDPANPNDILAGGSLDRWRFTYDGRGEKVMGIIDNTRDKVLSIPAYDKITVAVNSTGEFISAVKDVEGFATIGVKDINSGKVLISTNTEELRNKDHVGPAGSALTLWKLSNNSVHWSKWRNNEEVLWIELEMGGGTAMGAIVNPKTWTVSAL